MTMAGSIHLNARHSAVCDTVSWLAGDILHMAAGGHAAARNRSGERVVVE